MAVIIVVQTHTINLTALHVTYDVQVMFNVRSTKNLRDICIINSMFSNLIVSERKRLNNGNDTEEKKST